MFRRFTMLIGAVAVGYNQSYLRRKQLAGQFTRKCKEQPIAMGAVAFPFLVNSQILTRRFDFDDPYFASLIHCHQIGPATGG